MKHILIIIALIWGSASVAVQPDEILNNTMLETTARDISKGLRCPVCQNENIDDSNAAISRDLRILVRDLLLVGYLDALIAEIDAPEMDATIGQAQRDIMVSMDASNDTFLIDEPYIDEFLSNAQSAGVDVTALQSAAEARFAAADPNGKVIAYVVDKYGEFVLLSPQRDGANMILWLAPLVILGLALIAGAMAIRRKPATADGLSAEEKARLDEILNS